MNMYYYHLSWTNGVVTHLSGTNDAQMRAEVERRCANLQMACSVVSGKYEVMGHCEMSGDRWVYVGKALA